METTNSVCTNEKGKNRNSSVELLRIIAMAIIALCHSVPYYGDYKSIAFIKLGVATTSISTFLFNVFFYMGQIGNILFVVCSSYFLLDKKVSRKQKIINMILDVFVISVIFIVMSLILRLKVPTAEYIENIFSITYRKNWFVGCYIMFYMVHPYLNIIIRNIKKEQLLRLNVVLIIIYCVLQLVFKGKYYFTDLVGFIVIYFIVAFMKNYMPEFMKNNKRNIIIVVASTILTAMLLIITNIVGLKVPSLSKNLLYFKNTTNPFSIALCIGLFNIFNNRKFENKFVNKIASVSLLFYLIHENALFRYYMRPKFYELVFPYGHKLLWVLLEAVLLFVFGIILALIYKNTLQKLTNYLSEKIYNLSKKIYLKFEKHILKN